MSSALHGHLWRNWSGLEEAVPRHVETPGSVEAVVDVVRRAREGGTTVKMTGTGHSFTAIAAPEHTLLRPEGLRGILSVDRAAMTVTARAGTTLKDLNLIAQSFLHTLEGIYHARPQYPATGGTGSRTPALVVGVPRAAEAKPVRGAGS